MYKFKYWFGFLKGKIIISVLFTFLITLTILLPLILVIKSNFKEPINTHAYGENSNVGVNQSVDYRLGINDQLEYSNNVEFLTARESINRVRYDQYSIGYAPLDLYWNEFLYFGYYFNLYTISDWFNVLEKFSIQPLLIVDSDNIDNNIESSFEYPIFQTYNIFFDVKQSGAYKLSPYLYGNNPEGSLWNRKMYGNNMQVQNEKQAELALSFMFYNWLLYYNYSYNLRGESFIYRYSLQKWTGMSISNFIYYIYNTGLYPYIVSNNNEPITLKIAGPKESEKLVNKLIYGSVFNNDFFNQSMLGFEEFCYFYLDISIDYQFIEMSNDQIFVDSNNDDIYLKIQTRGMYDGELSYDSGYSNYHINESNYYSLELNSKDNDYLLYYTFYVRPIIFFINSNFVYLDENNNQIRPNWISTDGLNLIYTKDFTLSELILYDEMGEY